MYSMNEVKKELKELISKKRKELGNLKDYEERAYGKLIEAYNDSVITSQNAVSTMTNCRDSKFFGLGSKEIDAEAAKIVNDGTIIGRICKKHEDIIMKLSEIELLEKKLESLENIDFEGKCLAEDEHVAKMFKNDDKEFMKAVKKHEEFLRKVREDSD